MFFFVFVVVERIRLEFSPKNKKEIKKKFCGRNFRTTMHLNIGWRQPMHSQLTNNFSYFQCFSSAWKENRGMDCQQCITKATFSIHPPIGNEVPYFTGKKASLCWNPNFPLRMQRERKKIIFSSKELTTNGFNLPIIGFSSIEN